MVLSWIKYFGNRLFSSKYVRYGQCKQCGKCCRSIVLLDMGKPIKTEEEFDQIKKKYKAYNHFYPSGRDNQNQLLFTCKSLGEDNLCRDYFFRSLYCRKYPNIDKKFIMSGGRMLDGCGYKIEPSKKFSDYLD